MKIVTEEIIHNTKAKISKEFKKVIIVEAGLENFA